MNEHLGSGDGFENLASGLQPIEQRHGNVHQNQRWTKFFGHGDSLPTIFRFANHFEVVFEFQKLSDCVAHYLVIVRQQDFNSFHGLPSLFKRFHLF